MALSVLSALARSDLDPWQEAAALSGLPEKNAAARLARLIAVFPGRPTEAAAYAATAARLIALLPRRTTAEGASHAAGTGVSATPNSWAVVCMVLMVLALGAQWFAAGRPVAADVHAAATAPTAMVSPSDAPPNIGQ